MAVLAAGVLAPDSQAAAGGYSDAVRGTGGLLSYWRLGEASGTSAADQTGRTPGTLVGGVTLGARGGLNADTDTAAQFDAVDDEMQAPVALGATGTLEGWFFWEAGVAVWRDSTSSGGWILAFDSAGKVAYRTGGPTLTTALPTAGLRDGWHHLALTVAGGTATLFVDGAAVHSGPAGATPAVMPWHVMRNGVTSGQFSRGRADELAVYDTALDAATIEAHFKAGRDVADTTAPAAPAGLTANAVLGRVVLDWPDSAETDLDGYDVLRATSASGPFTRVNASRLSASAYTDTAVTGGTSYVYAVTASDVANHRSADSPLATATPPSTETLLRRHAPELRYEAQEGYFADSAAEMTDNFVVGSRQNYLVNSSGTRLAAANPADPLANLSLGFLGDPVYADGRTATTGDYLDAANTTYQQDAQRMRAAGYADRVYGRAVASGGRTWLQYWLFYYYNPQNVLGFGVHEGDWEFVQIGLDPDGAPEIATYAQHSGGEQCAWSRVVKSGDAPVVYVALASHASYFTSGVHRRGLYPDDYHRGSGYRVRPALEVVTGSTPFLAWRGRWGGSSSSPAAPRRQSKWGDPGGFHASATACPVTATASRAGSRVRAPKIEVRRVGGAVEVRYRVRARSLLVSATRADAPDVTVTRRVTPRRSGVVRLDASGGPLVVQASAFAHDGSRSRVVTVPLA
jgi:Concanavalin A-like lectin/glucanases superfamily